ncbi:MAG: hypothetical protein FWC65_04120 [Treponema sp.]|nr:hypothetical protein [Treponema sp.]
MLPRAQSFFLMLFLVFAAPALFAQQDYDEPEPPPIGTDWFDFDAAVYARGDRTFTISLGAIFPTVFHFFDPIEGTNHSHNLSIGGTGSLAFNYFLNSHIFIGGELAGMFAGTEGGNMLFMVPFGFRVGYQFVRRQFEFPLSIMVGAAPQMRLDDRYFGLIVKPGASAFWRFNPDWSFGLNAVWWIVPQLSSSEHNVLGNFLTVTLSARYHF